MPQADSAYTTPLARRTILAGLAAVPLAPIAASAAPSGDHPDVLLLRLGDELRAAVAEWQAIEPAYFAASDALERARARNRHVLQRGGPDAWPAFCAAVQRDAPGADDVINRGNGVSEAADRVAEAAQKIPPATLAGLAVHAAVLEWFFRPPLEAHRDDLSSWDNEVALTAAAHIRALATGGLHA